MDISKTGSNTMFKNSFARGLARITTAALTMACLSGAAQAAGYTLTLLGDLPGGPNRSEAHGLNDAGQVVGYSDDATGRQAFLWDAVGGMQGLGDLPGGNVASYAYDINNVEQVVGQVLPKRWATVHSCGTPRTACRTLA
jgi:probable HAF family extracellular repeat protein